MLEIDANVDGAVTIADACADGYHVRALSVLAGPATSAVAVPES